MRKLFVCLIFWPCVWSNFAHAQELLVSEPFQEELDSITKVVKPDSTTVDLYIRIGKDIVESSPVDAEGILQQAIQLAEELSYQRGVVLGNLRLSLVYLEFTRYEKALQCLINAQETIESNQLDDLLGRFYNHYGIFYYAQAYYDEALSYYRKCLGASRKQEDLLAVSKIYNNIGATYHEQDDYDSALVYYHRSLELKELLQDQMSMDATLGNIGSIYVGKKEPVKALAALHQSRKISLANQARTSLSLTHRLMAQSMLQLNDLDSARFYLVLAEDDALQTQSPKMLFLIYEQIANYYEARGNLKEALDYHRQYTSLKDSVFNNENTKAILSLRDQYETQKKDLKIANQQANIELLETRQEQSRSVRTFLIVVIILVSALAFISWKSFKSKRRKDRRIHEQASMLKEAELKQLNMDLEYKTKELTTNALQMIQKNDFLQSLKDELDELSKSISLENKEAFNKIRSSIDQNFNSERNWEEFKLVFEQVNQNFFERIHETAPEISPAELKLAALLRLNLSSKEIAEILGISAESVKTSRSRLRKKLNLERESNLVEYMMSLN